MKKIRKLIKIGIFFVMGFVLINFSLFLYCYITPKMSINKRQSFYLYDNKEELVFNNQNDWIGLDKISSYLVDATINTEDKRFYKHMGIDYIRVIKAIYVNILSGSKKEGASTITQQYARNLFLNFDKTWKRKIDEALLALELETHYTKKEILEGYLNTINYGGVFGIENASKYYFGKSARDLDLAESAMLAGIPKSPNNYSPFVNYDLAKKRQETILKMMYKNKVISKDDFNNAKGEFLVFNTEEEKKNIANYMYFQDAVMDELYSLKSIPKSLIETGGIKIYTTLDTVAQLGLEESFKKNIINTDLQASGIMMDPNNGNILALMGGVNYNKSQFNRATMSKRPVGSTMKPLLYYAALENGLTASSCFTSEKTTFTFSGNKTYSPQNYNNLYPNGEISMAAAIAYSDNIYAVKTHLFLGEEVLVDIAKRVGISSKLKAVPSLALGSVEISLIDMASAYASFANLGYKVKPHFISKVEDNDGNVLYEYSEIKENILNKSITYILNQLLTATYDTAFIDYISPTIISLLPEMTHRYAVKSGTTESDLWIIGYNKNIVVGIWNGYDDNRELTSKDNGFHKKVWIESIEYYLNNKDFDKNLEWYDMPNNVVGILVDPISGKVAEDSSKKSKIFYFIKGSEPYYNTFDAEKVFREQNEE